MVAAAILLVFLTSCGQYCEVKVESDPPEGGEVTGGGSYRCGTVVELKAEAAEGYRFVGFFTDDERLSSGPTHRFELRGDVHWVAKFVKLVEISAATEPAEAGEVTGAGSYAPGDEVTLHARAGDGYEFVGWMEGNESVGRQPDYRFTAADPRGLTAVFRRAVDVDAVLQSQLMGQPIHARVNPGFSGVREDERIPVGVAVGEQYVVAWEEREGELVLLGRDDLQEQARTRFDLASSRVKKWEGFFWGDLLVLLIHTDSGDLVAVYDVSPERITRIWQRELQDAWAELVGSPDARHLAVYGRTRDEISSVELLGRRDGRLVVVWEKQEDMRVTDLTPYGDEGLLLAEADRGWLLLRPPDESLVELGVGGAHERAAWETMGRGTAGEMKYRLHAVGDGGAVIASVDGVLEDGAGQRLFGAYYQLWIPAGAGMALVAESFLIETEGGGRWFLGEEEGLGGSFYFDPRTSRWLSWRGMPMDALDAGGHYSELRLDREARDFAAQDGMHGADVRIGADGSVPRPLSDLLTIETRFGYRSNRAVMGGDFTGTASLDLLLSRSDGIHVVTGGTEVEAVRVAGPEVALAGVDEVRRQVYLFLGGELVRLSYRDLLDVRRQTVFAPREATWSARVRHEVTALAVGAEGVFVLDADRRRQEAYLRALDPSTGVQEWAVEVVAGGPDHLAVIDGMVRLVDGSGELQVVDPRTGETIRSLPLQTETDFARSFLPVHFMDEDRVFVSEWVQGTGRFLALCARRGEEQWRLDIPGYRVGEAARLDDRIYVSAGDMGEGFLYGIDPETGEVVVEHETGIGGAIPPVKENDFLVSGGYGAGDYAFLYTLEGKTGDERQFDLGYKALVVAPAINEGILYTVRFSYGPLDGVLVALDLHTGEELWVNEGTSFATGPVFWAGRVHLADSDRHLYAVDAETGRIAWEFCAGVSTEVEPPGYMGFGPSPLVVQGVLYYPAGSVIHAVGVSP